MTPGEVPKSRYFGVLTTEDLCFIEGIFRRLYTMPITEKEMLRYQAEWDRSIGDAPIMKPERFDFSNDTQILSSVISDVRAISDVLEDRLEAKES